MQAVERPVYAEWSRKRNAASDCCRVSCSETSAVRWGAKNRADGVARNADAAPAAGAEGGKPHRGALVQLGIGR